MLALLTSGRILGNNKPTLPRKNKIQPGAHDSREKAPPANVISDDEVNDNSSSAFESSIYLTQQIPTKPCNLSNHHSDEHDEHDEHQNSVNHRVQFSSELITSIQTRPRTLTAEKPNLYWTATEMKLFRSSSFSSDDEEKHVYNYQEQDSLNRISHRKQRGEHVGKQADVLNAHMIEGKRETGTKDEEQSSISSFCHPAKNSSINSPPQQYITMDEKSTPVSSFDDDEDEQNGSEGGPHLLGSLLDEERDEIGFDYFEQYPVPYCR